MSNSTGTITNNGLLSDATYTCMGVYLTILGITSTTLNGMVIIVLVKGKPRFNKMHHALLLNLAVADLLISVLAYPLSSSSSYAGRWLFTDGVCTMYGFLVFSLAMGDMNTLVCIAICRYITACKPQYEYLLQKDNIKYFLIVIWSYAIIWTGAPLVGWSQYLPEPYGTSCTINWHGKTVLDQSYNITITFTCFVIHISIYIFCYSNVIRMFKSADNSSLGVSCSRQTGSQVNIDDTYNIEMVIWYHRIATSKKVTVLSLAMVTFYVLTWTPYAVLSLYAMYAEGVPVWVYVIPTMLAKSSTLTNSIVYALFSRKFRNAAKKLFRKKSNTVAPAPNAQRTGTDIWRVNRDVETTRYSAHLLRNGIYIGRNNLTLPREVHII